MAQRAAWLARFAGPAGCRYEAPRTLILILMIFLVGRARVSANQRAAGDTWALELAKMSAGQSGRPAMVPLTSGVESASTGK